MLILRFNPFALIVMSANIFSDNKIAPLQSPIPLLQRSAGVETGREGYASRALCSGRSNQAGQASRRHQGDDYGSDPQGPTRLKRSGEPLRP